jgi:hypothetical protein
MSPPIGPLLALKQSPGVKPYNPNQSLLPAAVTANQHNVNNSNYRYRSASHTQQYEFEFDYTYTLAGVKKSKATDDTVTAFRGR